MAELKTKPTKVNAADFLDTIQPPLKRDDSLRLLKLFQTITGEPPVMWGTSIIGFGSYHYESKSGQKGDWLLTGFSPRKQNLTLYLMGGFTHLQTLLEKLGKHKTSVGCLYFNKLSDIDIEVLTQIIQQSVAYMKKTYLHHK